MKQRVTYNAAFKGSGMRSILHREAIDAKLEGPMLVDGGGDMGGISGLESDSELDRRSAIALEWLSDGNHKFGESLKSLVTYLVAGNIAGVLAVVKIASEPPTGGLVATPLKVGLCAFSFGALAAVVAALFLVASQWKCLNVFRKRVVDLHGGSISIQEFCNAPNFYAWAIGSFQVSAIAAFLVGGTGLSLWVLWR